MLNNEKVLKSHFEKVFGPRPDALETVTDTHFLKKDISAEPPPCTEEVLIAVKKLKNDMHLELMESHRNVEGIPLSLHICLDCSSSCYFIIHIKFHCICMMKYEI